MHIRQKLSVTALGTVEILTGILLLINPVGLTTWIIIIAGIILTLIGIFKIIAYFRLPAEEAALQKSLVFGILAVLAGVWCMFRSSWFIALFPLLTTLYGLIVLISGVTKIQWSADMIRLKKRQWGWMALSAAITIICAATILRHPFAAAATLWMFIGITMIVEAIIDILSTIFIRDHNEDFVKMK